MKTLFTILMCLSFCVASAQITPKYAKDVESIDSILEVLYAVISGPAGEPRDWERFIHLFAADGKLIPTRKNQEGITIYRYWTPQEYRDMFVSSRSTVGFFELELNRVIESYGAITHVFSTYETRELADGPATNRGINSIQLYNDGSRWFIMNIFWSAESDGYPLPEKYLKGNK